MTESTITDTPYRVLVGSLPDYDELVAEIYIGDRFVGLLSQESGPGRILFEIASSNDTMKLDLEVCENAIAEAKARLRKLVRKDSVRGERSNAGP